MSVWRDDASLACWAGLSPANNASAGKKKTTRIGDGGHYLKPLLIQCALGAAKSTKKDPYFQHKYETLKKHRGHKKAVIAIARKMLVAIYHMIKDDADFAPVDHEDVIQNTKKTKGLNLNNVIIFLKEQGADESTIRMVETQCSGKRQGSYAMSKIITQNDLDAKLVSDSISNFFTRFHIAKELKRANAKKEKGFSPMSIFRYLFLLVFSGKSMYMDYLTGKTEGQFAKDTVYRFMKSIHINWLKFTIAVAARVANEVMVPATGKDRVNAFIIDDSVFSRCRSKSVELLAKIYDHAEHKYLYGIRMLTLGWTDGNSFIPVNSVLLSSEKKKSRINEANDIDKRTNGYYRRSLAMRKGTEVMLDLLKYAKKALIPADYVLFDSWLTSPKTIHAVRELGYHVIGMVKKSPKMTFVYCGEMHSLTEIYRMNKKRRGHSKYLPSVEVGVEKNGIIIPARIVYVRNRTNRKEYLCILSTNTTLDENEVICIYGKWWQIECFFKVCKSYLRLAKECRSLSYDAMTAHVAVVFTRYMMLSVEHREEEDPRTLGELFLYFLEELADITWLQALKLIMDMFRKIMTEEFSVSSEKMEELVDTFLSVLTPSIQHQLKASAAN